MSRFTRQNRGTTMLTAVRAAESRAPILRGDAGVGKTALLDHLSERATEVIVLRAAGVESDMELPFADSTSYARPSWASRPTCQTPSATRSPAGTIPWRARAAEDVLLGGRPGRDLFVAAASAAIADPYTVAGTAFKVPLAERTIVRVLEDLVA